MSPTLSIQNLSCHYDTQFIHGKQTIIDSLSIDLDKGEILCLLGASGCGKTTLLKAIAGLLPISAGKISVNDKILDDDKIHLTPEQRNVGMIFQDYALFPHLTVAENIAFGLPKSDASANKKVVEEMLALIQMSDFANRYPHNLSGGQQQRVAIARSLACQPDLLLLDEPFSNIDNQVLHDLIREIKHLFKRQNVTAIFVTHSREEAFAFADKLAVMNHGKIEQYGTAHQLYHHPDNVFVANFLGAGNFLPAAYISSSTDISPSSDIFSRTDTDKKDKSTHRFNTVLGDIDIISGQDFSPEKSYQLFIRPQHVIASSCPSPQTCSAQACLDKAYSNQSYVDQSYKVTNIQFMGDFCRYVIDVGQHTLLAMSCEPLTVGSSVTLTLDKPHSLIFEI